VLALVCIDVDGTLVGAGGVVPAVVWNAAARARAAGVRLALCTGRPAFGITGDYARRLDADGWHVFQNGASIVRPSSGESHSVALPREAVDALVRRARAAGRILELYSDADYAVELDADDRARRHAGLLGVPFAMRDLLEFPGPVVRAQWLVPHHEVEQVLAEPHPGLLLSPSLSPVVTDTTFINVTPAGVDKAAGVLAVARAYDVPADRVMLVGDGENDVTAMGVVGVAVAMGNAEPGPLAAARHTVSHVDDGGLAEALEMALRM
jgi:Cof subfamily protein (haloacid dehalogenase superfamily)